MIQIIVSERNISATPTSPVTSGSVGLPVKWTFSEEWDELVKTAVFRGSGEARDVALFTDECAVPAEVLTESSGALEIGVYGRLADGTLVMPTIWARIDYIRDGALPSEVSPSDPEPDWTAQVQAAASHPPQISNGYWYVWDVSTGAYVNTSVKAEGEDGVPGQPGRDGQDGAPGQPGRDGEDGQDGYSPTVTVTDITGGHRVTITDETGPHSFDVMDGQGGGSSAVQSVNGKTGDVTLDAEDVGALPEDTPIPSKTSDLQNDSGFLTQHQSLAAYRTAAAQDTIDAGKQAKITASGMLKGDGQGGVSAATPGTDYATPQQVNDKYTKPASGIPETDLAQSVQTSLGKADTALQAVPNTYRTAAAQDVIDATQTAAIPNTGTVSASGVMSFKHGATELFTVQLPLYNGGVSNGT